MELLLKYGLSQTKLLWKLGPLYSLGAFRRREFGVHSHEGTDAVPIWMAELS